MAEDTNFKFGVWMMTMRPLQIVGKLGQLGTGTESCDLFLNFGTPCISKKWLKIEKSNLVHGLIARRPVQKVAKLGQLGTGTGSHDLLLNFGAPLYI